MKGKYIFIIILVLLVGGILTYIYFKKEKPIQEISGKYSNVNILSSFNGDLIGMDYKLYLDGSIYREGKTSIFGAVQEKIPPNKTFQVLFDDLNSVFYSYLTQPILSVENGIYRVDIKPKSIGKLNATIEKGFFGFDENLSIKISSNKNFNEIILCGKHSFAILEIKAENLIKINKPNRYRNYDVCYDLNTSISNNFTSVLLNYDLFSELKENDYMNITFIDKNTGFGGSYSELNGKDIGAEDVTLSFKI